MDIVCGEHFDIFFGKTHCTAGHDLVFEICQRVYNCMSKNLVKSLSAGTAAARKRKINKLSGGSSV